MRDFGSFDPNTGIIRINKRKNKKSKKRGELIDTIVHEEMHARHPKMYEKTVRKKTVQLLKKMSRNRKNRLYSKYS